MKEVITKACVGFETPSCCVHKIRKNHLCLSLGSQLGLFSFSSTSSVNCYSLINVHPLNPPPPPTPIVCFFLPPSALRIFPTKVSALEILISPNHKSNRSAMTFRSHSFLFVLLNHGATTCWHQKVFSVVMVKETSPKRMTVPWHIPNPHLAAAKRSHVVNSLEKVVTDSPIFRPLNG